MFSVLKQLSVCLLGWPPLLVSLPWDFSRTMTTVPYLHSASEGTVQYDLEKQKRLYPGVNPTLWCWFNDSMVMFKAVASGSVVLIVLHKNINNTFHIMQFITVPPQCKASKCIIQLSQHTNHRRSHLNRKLSILKDKAGDIIYFTYCQQIPW